MSNESFTSLNKSSNVFPLDYAKVVNSSNASDFPMIGFQAVEVDANSSISKLTVHNTNKWAWLPVPIEGLSTSYQQGWEENTVNVIGAAASTAVAKIFGTSAPAFDPSGQQTNSGTLDGGTIGEFIKQKALGALGVKGIGKRMLEQAYVSYSGPGYRTFSFNFALRPKSEAESNAIEDIVFFFKNFSSPELMGGTMDLVRMYKVPHLFKIKLMPDDGLFKIGVSALTEVSVKYGGEKYSTFKDSNRPVQTDIALSFKEMHMLQKESFPDKERSF